MKRIAIVLPLLAGLAMPLFANSLPTSPVMCEVTELPWSTVSAVLKEVTEVRDYSYSQLVDWYGVGRVTVEQSGSGYLVTITDDDGIADVVLIESL